jgi:hypothetical protein
MSEQTQQSQAAEDDDFVVFSPMSGPTPALPQDIVRVTTMHQAASRLKNVSCRASIGMYSMRQAGITDEKGRFAIAYSPKRNALQFSRVAPDAKDQGYKFRAATTSNQRAEVGFSCSAEAARKLMGDNLYGADLKIVSCKDGVILCDSPTPKTDPPARKKRKTIEETDAS